MFDPFMVGDDLVFGYRHILKGGERWDVKKGLR